MLPLDRPLNRKPNGDVLVRRIDEREAETWLRAVGGGFDGDSSLATEMRTILAPNFYSESAAIFLAEIDGQAVGGGAMYVHDGVVEFGSTSTLPAFRRRGVQTALLDVRLKLAQEIGCDLAMVITSPGTASQRNVMRLGFELAYTKAAMRGEGRLTIDDGRQTTDDDSVVRRTTGRLHPQPATRNPQFATRNSQPAIRGT